MKPATHSCSCCVCLPVLCAVTHSLPSQPFSLISVGSRLLAGAKSDGPPQASRPEFNLCNTISTLCDVIFLFFLFLFFLSSLSFISFHVTIVRSVVLFPCNLSGVLNYQSLAEKSIEIKHKNLAFRNSSLFC